MQAGQDLLAEVVEAAGAVQQSLDARAVGAGIALAQFGGQPRRARREGGEEDREVGVGQVAARQRPAGRPRHARAGEARCEQVHDVLGQLAVGGHLAAVDRQQRRAVGVEVDPVVPGHALRVVPGGRQQRTQAGEGPHHVGPPEVAGEVPVRHLEQVVDLDLVDARRGEVADVVALGRADQRELALVGNGEHDAPVRGLEDVGELVPEQPGHHDVAALDHPRMVGGRLAGGLVEEARDPRPGRIDQRARRDPALHAAELLQRHRPQRPAPVRVRALRAREHRGAVLGRVHGRQHHQPRVVDPPVRVDEAGPIAGLERRARRMLPQVHGPGARQPPAFRQVVVEEQARADHPLRPQVPVVRQHEAQRPGDVRGRVHQHLAFDERLAHQRVVVELEVTQAAVHELGARRGGVGREVVLLAQQHAQAPPGRVPRDAGAVDAAADHHQVVFGRSGARVAAVRHR